MIIYCKSSRDAWSNAEATLTSRHINIATKIRIIIKIRIIMASHHVNRIVYIIRGAAEKHNNI